MKKILFIARNELYSLFYSPIAWIMMIVFLVMTAAQYLHSLGTYLGYFERGGFFLMFTDNLTDSILSDPNRGYLYTVIENLYIFFPLITMGLISREVSNGTIKLLYSSPIRIREMIFGKFLALVCFSLVLIVLLIITLACLSLSLTHPDYGHLAAATIGVFLILCTYSAIGLFISSLTAYQIVAAIVTLAVFALFSHIGDLWQDIDSLRNITYYLNIRQKSQDLLRGIYNSRDVVYFIVITAVFLLFTIIRIKSATESISLLRKTSRYMVVIAIAFALCYITSRPSLNGFLDTTRDQVHTITPPTRNMLSKLDEGPLEITAFWNLLTYNFSRLSPSRQNEVITSLWEPYIRFKPDIKINIVYYYNTDSGSYYVKSNPGKTLAEIAEKQARAYDMSLSRFLSPKEVNSLVNTDQEEDRCFFQLKYKGRTSIVRTFDDNWFWPSENEIAASINRLIATPPRIAFLDGQIERGPFGERPRDYKPVASTLGNRAALINQGYDFDTLSIHDTPIPKNIAALVIADPRTPFSTNGLRMITDYLSAGGNLFLAAEPDRKSLIKPLLDTLGLAMRDGLLIQPNDKFSSDCIFPYLSDSTACLSPLVHEYLVNERRYYGDSLFRVAMGGAAVLDYQPKNGFQIEPLLTTDKQLSWNRLAPISPDSLQLKVSRMPMDQSGNFTTAVLMHRPIASKEQRIIVAADADYLSLPLMFGDKPRRYNFDFGSWCFSYFSYGQFPANTARPHTDDSFRIKVADLGLQRMVLYYLLPILIAIASSILLIRRKRK